MFAGVLRAHGVRSDELVSRCDINLQSATDEQIERSGVPAPVATEQPLVSVDRRRRRRICAVASMNGRIEVRTEDGEFVVSGADRFDIAGIEYPIDGVSTFVRPFTAH